MLVHSAIAVLSTWPLVARLGDGLPLGREPVATVPWFNLWSLRWTAAQLPLHWDRWWDAPVFWPSAGAYARSELQPVTGLVFGALDRVVGQSAAYGLLVLVALTLNGVVATLLARQLGAGRRAALVAGALAQLTPFLFAQLGVLQLLMLWPVLLVVLLSTKWWKDPHLRTSVELGGAFALAMLTCSYHAALAGIAVALASPLVWRSHDVPLRRRAAGAVAAAGVAAALVLPFSLRQAAVLGDTVWTDATITAGSARLRDLIPSGAHWPGTVVVLGAIAGLVTARHNRVAVYFGALAAIAATLALGMHLTVLGFRPYAWLVDHVDVVARMRSPFRAIALTQAIVAVLCAPAIDRLLQRGRRVGHAILAIAVIAAVVPMQLGSGPISALPDPDLDWVRYLAEHPGGSVAMMPMPVTRPVEAFEPTARWMLQALDHGHPLVNGYTGFFPSGDRAMRLRMVGFPDRESVDELHARGVRFVVADPLWWTGERDMAARALGLEVISGGPDGTLLEIQSFDQAGN